ncbi:uncharacterized protein LACBIDRAFT_333156 [Laccaria bicolor S238N-H82]|uniref:Predicted protein n=1 Tax=Laccaria bicolor (strain S238N-H82 / ATCC MYA-4686) TaxID=486041 RepID=B0DV27_LACBS|nr:uncharacterized protein LACBIDRAFT_333156 [Laccaria bicolor S238N-H82]EDR01439.1 predicted protein [Laccaria bicolor S238N-H82]|eukprot:XP_001887791.1 predicted protein [Laccaria bicolor S238N-H82]
MDNGITPQFLLRGLAVEEAVSLKLRAVEVVCLAGPGPLLVGPLSLRHMESAGLIRSCLGFQAVCHKYAFSLVNHQVYNVTEHQQIRGNTLMRDSQLSNPFNLMIQQELMNMMLACLKRVDRAMISNAERLLCGLLCATKFFIRSHGSLNHMEGKDLGGKPLSFAKSSVDVDGNDSDAGAGNGTSKEADGANTEDKNGLTSSEVRAARTVDENTQGSKSAACSNEIG